MVSSNARSLAKNPDKKGNPLKESNPDNKIKVVKEQEMWLIFLISWELLLYTMINPDIRNNRDLKKPWVIR